MNKENYGRNRVYIETHYYKQNEWLDGIKINSIDIGVKKVCAPLFRVAIQYAMFY